MKEFINRIDDFIFDVLGLLLPGLVLIALLYTPLLLIDSESIDETQLNSSKFLMTLSSFSYYVQSLLSEQTTITLVGLLIIGYILGHLIKVFALIFYNVFKTLFDKLLLEYSGKLINWIYKQTFGRIKASLKRKKWLEDFEKIVRTMCSPIIRVLRDLFMFSSDNYNLDNESLVGECIAMINSRYDTNYPIEWYSIYKLYSSIEQQENLKSMRLRFLAKYNLYRSLSFLFAFVLVYYIVFFLSSYAVLSQAILSIKEIFLIGIFLLWFTFHSKYKRYWTLCGNETLVSLFYYLKKTSL